MTTFYDYEMHVHERHTTYVLRANMKQLPVGRCRVSNRDAGWMLTTCWRSRAGTRHKLFADLDQALASGIAWARRRERQEAKEIAAPPPRSTPTLVRSAP